MYEHEIDKTIETGTRTAGSYFFGSALGTTQNSNETYKPISRNYQTTKSIFRLKPHNRTHKKHDDERLGIKRVSKRDVEHKTPNTILKILFGFLL